MSEEKGKRVAMRGDYVGISWMRWKKKRRRKRSKVER